MNNYISNKILLIPPYHFAYNLQTADTNYFQHTDGDTRIINLKAMNEFEAVILQLEKHEITHYLLDGIDERPTPDGVFPNWFSLHTETGERTLVIYPMLTENRRMEVREEEISRLLFKKDLSVNSIIDLRTEVRTNEALEATGSLTLDRTNKIAYASVSARTSKRLVNLWCQKMGYTALMFESEDLLGRTIYHTDLVLNIWRDFSIVCLDAILDEGQQFQIEKQLEENSLHLIKINLEQVSNMCGNVIQVVNKEGESKILLTKTAFNAFDSQQQKYLEKIGDLVIFDIETIECIGGGGARCMVAELY